MEDNFLQENEQFIRPGLADFDRIKSDIFNSMNQPDYGMLTQNEMRAYSHHKRILDSNQYMTGSNGDITTYRGIVTNVEGREYLLPSYWGDGKVLDDVASVERARQIGLDKFPSFDTVDEALDAERRIHVKMSNDIKNFNPFGEARAFSNTLTDVGDSLESWRDSTSSTTSTPGHMARMSDGSVQDISGPSPVGAFTDASLKDFAVGKAPEGFQKAGMSLAGSGEVNNINQIQIDPDIAEAAMFSLSFIPAGTISNTTKKFTTNLLKRLPKSNFIKRATLEDLLGQKDLRELDVTNLRRFLNETDSTIISREDVERELVKDIIPLRLEVSDRYNILGLDRIHYAQGDYVNPESHLWTVPFNTGTTKHWENPQVIGHSRVFDDVGGEIRYVSELQSDPIQGNTLIQNNPEVGGLFNNLPDIKRWNQSIESIFREVPDNLQLKDGTFAKVWPDLSINNAEKGLTTTNRITGNELLFHVNYNRPVGPEQRYYGQVPLTLLPDTLQKRLAEPYVGIVRSFKENQELSNFALKIGRDQRDNLSSIIWRLEEERDRGLPFPYESEIKQFKRAMFERIVQEENAKALFDGKKSIRIPTGKTAAEIEHWAYESSLVNGKPDPALSKLYREDVNTVDIPSVKGKKFDFWDETEEGDVLQLGIYSPEEGYELNEYALTGKLVQFPVRNTFLFEVEQINDPVHKFFIDLRKDKIDLSRIPNMDNDLIDVVEQALNKNTRTQIARKYRDLYNIYEKQLSTYVQKKYGAKKVTDEKGNTWYEWTPKDEPITAYGVGAGAGVGVLAGSQKDKENQSSMQKLDPGVYQDNSGKLFKVTKDGEVLDLMDEM